MGQPGRILRQPPLATPDPLHLPGESFPGNAVVLRQARNRKARGKQRLMISPRPWFHSCVTLCAKPRRSRRRCPRCRRPSVRPARSTGTDHQQVIGTLVVQRPQHRVPLADEQPPARPQQATTTEAHRRDVGQPAQRADTRVHQVEPAEPRTSSGTVDIRLHERRIRAGRRARDGPAERQAPRSRARSSTRPAGRATPCRSRCGTAGAPRAARRCRRAAGRRSGRHR